MYLLTHIICLEGIVNGILGEKKKPAEVLKSAIDVSQRQQCTGRQTNADRASVGAEAMRPTATMPVIPPQTLYTALQWEYPS